MRRRFATATCSAVILSAVALGGQTTAPRVSADPRVETALELVRVWLEGQRAYDQIPGISAAVIYDQDQLWSGGYGFADLTTRRPADADTIYSICSISKLFTSVASMQLRDAGKLRLDDPVAKHLPWFAIKRAPGDGEITIEGLLTHASGLPREADYPYWTEATFPTHEQIVAGLRAQETLYPAEQYFQYSNLGLTLAGEIVAAEANMPYADYVRRNILEPLGLDHTTSEMPEGERGKHLATGYSGMTREGTRRPAPFFQARGIAPAAGYASTVGDLGRFASWQFRLLAHGGTEVLGANTLREMHRIHFVDPDFETTWGLGFSVIRRDGKSFVGHGGSCPGFQTELLMKIDDKVATVFMANAQGVNTQLWAYRMYEIVAPAIRAAKKEPDKAKALDRDLDRYLGSYEGAPFFSGEVAVVRWDDGLALLSLPTLDPIKNLTKLKKVGEHRFRRIRSDETLGEEIVFEMGRDGKAARFTRHNNYYPRVRATT
jgi:CubicO group peptidase (beta-lactamase class C family)